MGVGALEHGPGARNGGDRGNRCSVSHPPQTDKRGRLPADHWPYSRVFGRAEMLYNLQMERRRTQIEKEELIRQVDDLRGQVEEEQKVARRPKVSPWCERGTDG